jgi:hypothetical protein
MMNVSMFSKKNMDYGTQPMQKEMDLSRLSLKSNVYQQPVFILKDGKKVSLNPKLMRVKLAENYESFT